MAPSAAPSQALPAAQEMTSTLWFLGALGDDVGPRHWPGVRISMSLGFSVPARSALGSYRKPVSPPLTTALTLVMYASLPEALDGVAPAADVVDPPEPPALALVLALDALPEFDDDALPHAVTASAATTAMAARASLPRSPAQMLDRLRSAMSLSPRSGL